MPARILIVDDHEIVRERIRTLITRSRPEWELVGEASSGTQAIEMCEALKPDVMVLDITMPGMSGLEAASKTAALGLGCRVDVHDARIGKAIWRGSTSRRSGFRSEISSCP